MPTRFHTGGALEANDSCYIERKADREALNVARQGKYLYTCAPRQMGKTSLLKRIAAQMSLWGWKCCFVDLATMKGLDKETWFRHLGQNIAGDLNCPLRSPLKDQLDFRTFLLEDSGLGVEAEAGRVALFFDEIEGLTEHPFSDEFLMVLRDLYQRRDTYPGHLFVAFAGAVDTNALVKDPSISPFNVAEEITLEDFTREETRRLTLRLTDTGVPVDDEVHARVYSWTSGQPHLTQRVCGILSTETELHGINEITASEVDAVVQKRIINPHVLDSNVRHVLSNTAALHDPAASLWRDLLSGARIRAFSSGFYALYLTGAVVETSENHVVIRNRIYEKVLRSTQADGSDSGGDADDASSERSGLTSEDEARQPSDRTEATGAPSVAQESTAEHTLALVMKGGGAKGLAYLGAIQVLDVYYHFNWFVGTSAGAIAAVLLAAGYTARQLEPIFRQQRFSEFMDARFYQWPTNLIFKKGLFPGLKLNNWLEQLLNKMVAPGAGTAIRLEQLKHRCTVYAVRRGADALDYDSHRPETKTKEAVLSVRSSIAIPYIFQPQTDSEHRVFDGGLRHNYPLLAFVNKFNRNDKVNFIGLYLGSRVYVHRPRSRFILSDLLEYWLSSNDETALREHATRTIIIDPSPVSTLRFTLSEDEKEFLLAAGRAAALEFIAQQTELQSRPSADEVRDANHHAENLRAKVLKAYIKRKWVRRIIVIALIAVLAVVLQKALT